MSARRGAEDPRQERRKGSLSGRAIHHLYTTLRAALRYAVRSGLIAKSQIESIDLPKKGAATVCDLDEDGAAKLLEALRATPLNAPALIAPCTGLRRRELFALKWGDVDLDRGELHVRHSLESVGGRLRFKVPKTPRSRRTLPFAPQALAMLRAHREVQNQLRETVGTDYNNVNLIFCNPTTGEPWIPDTFGAAYYYLAR